jgi:hypothetical protein
MCDSRPMESPQERTDRVTRAVPCGVARRTAWFLTLMVVTMLTFLAITLIDAGDHSPARFRQLPTTIR